MPHRPSLIALLFCAWIAVPALHAADEVIKPKLGTTADCDEGLLLTTSRGFTQFAYAFVQEDADETEDKDLKAAEEMRARARQLYLRARDYGLRGLDVRHQGFEQALRADSKKAVAETTVKDVPLLDLDRTSLGSGHFAVKGQAGYDRRNAFCRSDDGPSAGPG